MFDGSTYSESKMSQLALLNFFDWAKYYASNETEAETLDAALGAHHL